MQEPKLLCPEFRRDETDTGDVAARPVETGDEASLTGSPPVAKTIGIVVVAAFAAIADRVSCAAIKPSSRNRCTKAATHGPWDEGVPATRNPRLARLLRSRRERPSNRCAAE